MAKNILTHEELTIAGFGGQGIIMVGKLLAQAAMHGGWQVTYMPSYGAEMRGGTAKCMIVIDHEPVDCPLVTHPDSLLMMNPESCEKYAGILKPGGLLLINSTLVLKRPGRGDIEILDIPADEVANGLGSTKCANMVMLGAWIKRKGQMELDCVCDCLKDVLAKRYHNLIPLNQAALRKGAELVG